MKNKKLTEYQWKCLVLLMFAGVCLNKAIAGKEIDFNVALLSLILLLCSLVYVGTEE